MFAQITVRRVGGAAERRTVNRGAGGLIPPDAVWKLSLYLSEETIKAGGLFSLVSVPGEVKYHTHV